MGPRKIRQRDLSHQTFVEIIPARIAFLDEFDFPRAIPALEPLLARDSDIDVFVYLIPDKDVNPVLFRETLLRDLSCVPASVA